MENSQKCVCETSLAASFFQFRFLSCLTCFFRYQQLLSQPAFLYPVMQFVYVESKCQKQIFRHYPLFSAPQEPVMTHVLFRDPEHAFRLDRAVDPQ